MKISLSLAKELVKARFPRRVDFPVRSVENMSVRLPTGELYTFHVGVEYDRLPFLSPRHPLPVPEPLGKGKPDSGCPWVWSINRWIPGEIASGDRIGDLEQFASNLAGFLNDLQRIDASDGPSTLGEKNERIWIESTESFRRMEEWHKDFSLIVAS